MLLICVEEFLEKLKEIKAMNKDRPLGFTMNMGINQAMDAVNTLPCYEWEEDDGNMDTGE